MPDSLYQHINIVEPSPAASYEAPAGFVADTTINTVIVDSIARDTVSGRIPHFIPVECADSLRIEAMIDSVSVTQTMPSLPVGSEEGIAPMGLPPVSSGSGLTALLTGTLVVAAINAAGIGRTLKSYRHELWSVRRRHNVFDDEHSASVPMAVLLALVFVVFGGIVLYNLPGYPPAPSFAGATASMALLACYYLFRYVAYRLVGFTFAGKTGAVRWINGFMATQAFAGLFLIVPALLLVVRPEWRDILVTISLTIYGAANILFIAKGFRIFYTKIQSLLYFILYLCTLEIIPMLAIYRLCVYLWAFTA